MKKSNHKFRKFAVLIITTMLLSITLANAQEVTFTTWTSGSLSTSDEYKAITDSLAITKITVVNASTTIADADLISIKTHFPNLTHLDLSGVNFANTQLTIALKASPKLKYLILPTNITSLALSALANCPELETVVLPAGLKDMATWTFANDTKLVNLNLEKLSIKSIGGNSFQNCTSLKEITFPSTIKSIFNGTFNGCTALQSITLNTTNKISLGNNTTFANCNALTQIIISSDTLITTSSKVFSDAIAAAINLYVPEIAVANYKNSTDPTWVQFNDAKIFSLNDFTNIKITVTPLTALLIAGNTTQLSASLSPVSTSRLVWTTADENIATVDANGLVTGKNAGTVRITASLSNGGASAYADITVRSTAEAVTGVSFSQSSSLVLIGTPVQLSSIITPSTATNKAVKYTSSLPSVASVDSISGVVTGKNPGTAIITATTDDGNYKATFIANVYREVLTLPSVLSSNMVMQQKTQATVWGWTAPNSNVQITASWGQSANAVADATGKWSAKIQTPTAVAGTTQTQHTLTFLGKNNTITLTNILIGDVYLCAGQSNMLYTMNKVVDAANEVAAANYPNIRISKASTRKEYEPFFHNASPWMECNSTNIGEFSGVAYYFGRHLHNNPNINIPIGLISPALGGSSIQSWISREALSANPELKSKVQDVYDRAPTLDHTSASNILYNGMLSSYIPFSLSGFLWYQGEANSNSGRHTDIYSKLLTTLINNWRTNWGQGNIPFYFVQLPAYNGFDPEIRDQQSKTLLVPNTGMAVTLDLADDDLYQIHPHNKKDVGMRLAKIAEANIYKQNVVFAGPMLDTFLIEGPKIRIKYLPLSIGTGLISRDGKALTHFKIAASDNVYVDATAEIDGNDVLVSSTTVSSPKNVTFAYTNTAIPNLTNKEDLMACPFRTVSWNYNISLGANSPNAINKSIVEKLDVFPVPVTEKLNVILPDNTKLISYTITDISGKIQSINNHKGFNEKLSIDVSNLSMGYYIIQLKYGDIVQTAPFIKK